MDFLGYFVPIFVVWIFFSTAYLISEKKNNYGYIDIIWGPSFVVISVAALITTSIVKGEYPSIPALLSITAVTIWGLIKHLFIQKKLE